MQIDFTGKKVLVTGGGRGLGKAIAILLAQCGADLCIANRKKDQGEQTVREIEALGRKAVFFPCDVAEESEIRELIEYAVSFAGGKLDCIIHVAGITLTQDFLVASDKEIRHLFDVNVMGTSHILRFGLKQMIEQKEGNIITFSSIAGRENPGRLQHYGASKAAVISLTQGAAKAGAPHNVRVNCIAPGIIRTDIWEEVLDGMASGWNGKEGAKKQTPEEREEMWQSYIKSRIPLGRAQTPEDIAWATAFIASDLAINITGQVLAVDGGITMV